MALLAAYDAVRPGSFSHLRRVIWCGEVMANAALTYWMQRVPQATFTNLYGPTEATIASSYYRVDKPPSDAREAIPIGQGCPGEGFSFWTTSLVRFPLGKSATSTSAAWASAQATGRTTPRRERRFSPTPGRTERVASTERAISHASGRTGSCTSSAGRTHR